MEDKRAAVKRKSHRWSRRHNESLQIGESTVTFKLSGRGKGRRVVAVVSAPEGVPVIAIESSAPNLQNKN